MVIFLSISLLPLHTWHKTWYILMRYTLISFHNSYKERHDMGQSDLRWIHAPIVIQFIWFNGLFQLKSIHPLCKIQHMSSTEGVCSSTALAYWVPSFKFTPLLWNILVKFTPECIQVLFHFEFKFPLWNCCRQTFIGVNGFQMKELNIPTSGLIGDVNYKESWPPCDH